MGEYDKYIQTVQNVNSGKGYDGFPSLKFLDTSGVDKNAAASETVDATAVKNNTKKQPFDYSKYYNKTDYGDYSKYYNKSSSSNYGNYSKYLNQSSNYSKYYDKYFNQSQPAPAKLDTTPTKTLSFQQVSPGINLDSSEVPADQFNKGNIHP